MADQEDIVMDGQVSHLTFNDRLNNDIGGRGNFAIADLDKNVASHQFETSFMKNDECSMQVKLPDLISKPDPIAIPAIKEA